jgi:hypothetical protein
MPPVSSRNTRDDVQYLSDEAGTPADGTIAAICSERDFGTSRWQLQQCYTKLLRCGRRFMARLRRASRLPSCPLPGAKQPRPWPGGEEVHDPQRLLTVCMAANVAKLPEEGKD